MGGGLFSIPVQKSGSKVLKTWYFPYFAFQWAMGEATAPMATLLVSYQFEFVVLNQPPSFIQFFIPLLKNEITSLSAWLGDNFSEAKNLHITALLNTSSKFPEFESFLCLFLICRESWKAARLALLPRYWNGSHNPFLLSVLFLSTIEQNESEIFKFFIFLM